MSVVLLQHSKHYLQLIECAVPNRRLPEEEELRVWFANSSAQYSDPMALWTAAEDYRPFLGQP